MPATIGVWLTIFVRVYSTLHGAETAVDFQPAANADPFAGDNEPDTFSIVNNYRDPFTEKPAAPKHTAGTASGNAVIKNPKPATVKKESSWPSIHYSGMIKNQKSNRQLAMLEIDGSQTAVTSGDMAGNVKVCRIFKDSIELMFEKQKRFFRK